MDKIIHGCLWNFYLLPCSTLYLVRCVHCGLIELNTRREIFHFYVRAPIFYTLFTQSEEQYAYADPNSNQPTPERSDTYSYVTIRPDAAAAMAAGTGSAYASIARPKQWEVPKRNVRLDKELGSGHFGLVMKGFLKTKQGIQVVAVKMLKGRCAKPGWLILLVSN